MVIGDVRGVQGCDFTASEAGMGTEEQHQPGSLVEQLLGQRSNTFCGVGFGTVAGTLTDRNFRAGFVGMSSASSHAQV